MAKKFLYFQPEYVKEFKCDGSKCNALCCKNWRIDIDSATYKKYSRIKPTDKAKEITSLIKVNLEENLRVITLDQRDFCPFLTEDNLCKIQLEYGEDFLSQTCVTYPRHTFRIGKFFERSLTLTCPVAAEMILFNREPMQFEWLEVPDKIHGKHGRIKIDKFPINDKDAELVPKIQATMISILQRRDFSIDQRLIVLGLFLDKLQELVSSRTDTAMILSLIEVYQSEEFLSTEMPLLFQGFVFDPNKFVTFIMKFISHTVDCLRTPEGKDFLISFEKVLGIKPDENDQVYVDDIIASFERLADARKNFSEKYSTFLENYLVNELFFDIYPWRFISEGITKNFIVFLISYKIFEMMMFATVHSGLDSKENLLAMVDWFMNRTDHNKSLYKRFLELLRGIDNTYLIMATLL